MNLEGKNIGMKAVESGMKECARKALENEEACGQIDKSNNSIRLFCTRKGYFDILNDAKSNEVVDDDFDENVECEDIEYIECGEIDITE